MFSKEASQLAQNIRNSNRSLAILAISVSSYLPSMFALFGRGAAGKDTMWYQEEKSTIETTEVSDASSHYMSG